MPFACLLSKLLTLWHFHFKMSNSMLYVMFGILVGTTNVFCFKESPFGLSGVSFKAMFFCFALNCAFLHVSCVLLVFKFYANMHLN